ncbi:MAG: putative aminotransferase [Proteobacteria bacterium]|nr:putative aminotransferase [Pseudomonadota bacterium]
MNVRATEQSTQIDYKFWHPMCHPGEWKQRERLNIVKSDGLYVWDDKGNKMVDGFAGLWCVNVGHGRPEVKEAIVKQMNEQIYGQLFEGVMHPRAADLAEKLVQMTAQEGMARVLYGTGGSDGVETALKIARQYWRVQGMAGRTKFISLKNAYHGVHFGGASVTGINAFRLNYEPVLAGCYQVDTPWLDRNPWTENPEELGRICADMLEREIIQQGPETVAAFIAEPVQGAGGVIVPPANYWPLVRAVCDKYGILLIADEVVTGFGRSGCLFGSRGWGVKPDIMVFAKALTAGYIPLSATMLNQRIADAFENNADFRGVMLTGYTYGGHPLGCAAALAVLDIVEKEDLPGNAARIGDYMMQRLKPFEARFRSVGNVRGKGLMFAIDLVQDKKTREMLAPTDDLSWRLAAATREAGAVIRPVGSKLVIAPPLVLDQARADVIVDALESAFVAIDR